MAGVLVVAFLSFIGVPPLAGFVAKLALMGAAAVVVAGVVAQPLLHAFASARLLPG